MFIKYLLDAWMWEWINERIDYRVNEWRLSQWMHKKMEVSVTREQVKESVNKWVNEWYIIVTVKLMPQTTINTGYFSRCPAWLSCVVFTAICLGIFIRVAIFHSIVLSWYCTIVIICPQMIRKTLRWLKKSFSNCESPNEYQCSWARLPKLVCHYVNLMLIKMVIGWEFSKVPLTGQGRLPTGLEGEELTVKERKVHWVLLGLELTHAPVCSGGLQGARTHAGFILSQWSHQEEEEQEGGGRGRGRGGEEK